MRPQKFHKSSYYPLKLPQKDELLNNLYINIKVKYPPFIAKINPTKILNSFGKSSPKSGTKKRFPDITANSTNQTDKNAAFKT